MKKILSTLIKGGLRGKNTHLHPHTALRGLTPEKARTRPNPDARSCWEILHHTKVWQRSCMDLVEGKTVSWKTIQAEEWPSQETLSDDTKWDELVSTFKTDLKKAVKLTESADLVKPMPGWDNNPTIHALLVLAQHNSYHLGQIVAVRKHLGYWPPPKAKE